MWAAELAIHILYSQDAVIRDVTVETDPGHSPAPSTSIPAGTCGFQLQSRRRDDAITLKAGKDADGRRVNRRPRT